MPGAAAAAASVLLEIRFERVRTVRGIHNGNGGGKDTIKRPEDTLGIRREVDRHMIAPEIFISRMGGLVRLARLRCRHFYVEN